jgi:hypothetical protein
MKAMYKSGLKSRSQTQQIWRSMQERLLTGLITIGGIAVVNDASLEAQGLQVVPSPFINNSTLSGAAIIADNDVWAVGDISGSVANAETTLAQHFDGTNWSVISSPNPTSRGNSFLEGIATAATNDVWAVGGGTGVGPVTEHWDGQSWEIVPTPSAVRSLNGVAARSGTVVAVGVGTDNSTVILHN